MEFEKEALHRRLRTIEAAQGQQRKIFYALVAIAVASLAIVVT